MEKILSCYYLDEPLDEEEMRFVMHTLIGPWARFRTGATVLQQKRVPAILPLPDADGRYVQSREQRAWGLRKHLHRAGIHADCGRQVLWVTPRDTEWDAIFQFAIHHETGFGPFVAQRRFAEDGTPVPGALRVIDTHMLLRGLK